MYQFIKTKSVTTLIASFICITIIASFSQSITLANAWTWSRNRGVHFNPKPTPTPTPTSSGSFKLFGYYPTWSVLGFPITQVPINRFDGVLHAFVYPDSKGKLVIPANFVYPLLTQTTKTNGKLAILSVGGAINSDSFKTLISNMTVRNTFVASLAQFVRANGYNGVDLDWEYPNGTQEAMGFAALADAIRQSVPGIIITTAMPIAPTNVGVDIAALQKSFDLIFVMAYDIEGGWDGYAGHNAPLYKNSKMPADTSISHFIDTQYIGKGVPKEKLILGLALYGRKFNVSTPYMKTSSSDTIEYKNLPFSSCTKQLDQVSMVPYLSCGSYYVSYDDTTSIAAKISYAKSKGLAGAFYWAFGQDNNQIVNAITTK